VVRNKINFMKSITLNQMEMIEAGRWQCAAAIAGGFLGGMAACSGNGTAFFLGPVGVTWSFIGGVGGGLLGASQSC
jgi:hypothetical protein